MPIVKLVARAVGAAATVILSACAATPSEPVRENLDPNTATTVIVLTKPVELFSQNTRGKVNDPFAYLAPFETDSTGTRALFLWVSAPLSDPPSTTPQVLCNDQALSLQTLGSDGPGASGGPTVTADLAQIGLSRGPYVAPVPWSIQWYFRLTQDDLKCLAEANGIALVTHAPGAEDARYTAERKDLAALAAFSSH
jgi:hypothetical protein